MKEKVYNLSPHCIQNLIVSMFNYLAYKKRMGGEYRSFRRSLREGESMSMSELSDYQSKEFIRLVKHARKHSKFYKNLYKDVPQIHSINDIEKLPIVSKEDLRKGIDQAMTISKSKGVIGKTGGTTGKSLEVVYTKRDTQLRFAFLDNFRSNFGYELGEKTAWFSGKRILTNKDLKKHRFWKMDIFNHVKYYSTFHIRNESLKYYLMDIIKFEPKYLIGFPSAMFEIAKFGMRNNILFPPGTVRAIFPTAEALSASGRKCVEEFFGAPMYDQYASSEGAPFIYECAQRKLHMDPRSGVFEVLNEQNKPAKEGRLVVTSFSTYGTPLIRYDIGDEVILSEQLCNCGFNGVVVAELRGRMYDYVYSQEMGKINVVNAANALKETRGIIQFQVIQDSLDSILIKMVIDRSIYDDVSETKFVKNWRDRLGERMKLEIVYVDHIELESSGKFRMLKNNVTHLIP